MAEIRQKYRGTTAQCDAYLGPAGQIVIDTTLNEIRVHDGLTMGGIRLPNLATFESYLPDRLAAQGDQGVDDNTATLAGFYTTDDATPQALITAPAKNGGDLDLAQINLRPADKTMHMRYRIDAVWSAYVRMIDNTYADATYLGIHAKADDADKLDGNDSTFYTDIPARLGYTPPNFPSGTRLVFQQTAAPPGWTKDTTHNNKALRITNGSVSTGGTQAFTTAFASNRTPAGTISSTAISLSQMPAHAFSVSGSTSVENPGGTNVTTIGVLTPGSGGSFATWVTGVTKFGEVPSVFSGPHIDIFTQPATIPVGDHSHTMGNHNHAVSIMTNTLGSNAAHGHNFTGAAMAFDVQYVDVIIAQRD